MRETTPNFQNEKESLAEQVEWEESTNLYQQYVSELKLTPEDLSKKILDVGANFGHFAEKAKQEGYGGVYSIDIAHPASKYTIDTTGGLKVEKMAVADAFKLPFENESFDLVISFCAIPNVVEGLNPTDYGNEAKKVFQEMLRVVRVGGEIRLGRVVSEFQQGDHLRRGEQIRKTLQWFDKSSRFQTSVEVTGRINEDPAYLVRIKKLKA